MSTTINKPTLLGLACILGIVAFLVGRFTGGAEINPHGEAGQAMAEAAAAAVWTCSMHPQVRQPDFGACPICGMDLIPAASDDDGNDDSELPRLSVSARSAALMNVQTWPVERREITVEKPLLGRVLFDESRTYDVVVRSDSFIERLFTNFSGVAVRRGDALAELYSPNIYAAAEELLTAVRMGDSPGGAFLLRDARQRLRLLDVSDKAIDQIIESGEAPRTFTVDSIFDGVIIEMGGKQGNWLPTGQPLVKIVDTSTMWVWLDVFERDLPLVHYAQPVTFTVRSLPGQEFTGTVAFVPPGLDRQSRSFKVRLNVPNPNGILRDGMFVQAVLEASINAQGSAVPPDLEGQWISPMHPEVAKDGPGDCDVCGMDLLSAEELGLVAGEYEAPLLIPAAAALITGRRAVVYVRIPNAERPTFEMRQVELGPRAGDSFVVFSGLEEGEQVVTNGNFKIDSELQLRGRRSMMSAPKRGEPEEPKAGEELFQVVASGPVPVEFGAGVKRLVDYYLELAEGLALDDLAAARVGADGMTTVLAAMRPDLLAAEDRSGWGDWSDRMDAALAGMRAAEDIAGVRDRLQSATQLLEVAVRTFGAGQVQTLYLAHCPMAFGDQGGSWLQADRPVRNAYFGSMMFRCGEIQEEIEGL
jgi:membrane fusion protein, copper/silver efflux system